MEEAGGLRGAKKDERQIRDKNKLRPFMSFNAAVWRDKLPVTFLSPPHWLALYIIAVVKLYPAD